MSKPDLKKMIRDYNEKIHALEESWLADSTLAERAAEKRGPFEKPDTSAMDLHYNDEIVALKDHRDYLVTQQLALDFEEFERSLPDREAYPSKWDAYEDGFCKLTPLAIEEAREVLKSERRQKKADSTTRLALWAAIISAAVALFDTAAPYLAEFLEILLSHIS
ncbi:hypothetical protein [Salipiger abyssi]|uniref:hypothetical protein n=1 Tax=Salipiger abyssi TaxID=1250539 RepID=UPI0012EBF08E|nr:hypothetical protein [Salipiger abyssi]